MIPHEQWLKYLLYLDLSAAHPADFTTEHCTVMRSGSAIAFCNRAMATPAVSDTEIKTVIDYYGNTSFRWFVLEEDSAQIQKLVAHGLKPVDSHPAMLADLTTMQDKMYDPAIRVEEVQSADTLDSWVAVAAESMEVNATELRKLVEYILKHATPGTAHAYLAFYNNVPVATSMVIRRGDIVSVHLVGTLAEYRGKGIGYAITHKPLVEMRNEGGKTAILLASDMGKPVYEKMGFQQYAVYNKYEHIWSQNVT